MTPRQQAKTYQPAAALRRLVRNSPLLESAAQGRELSPLGWKIRPLTAPETLQLERQGCWSADWTRVRVQDSFETSPVRDTTFEGDVLLARFSGTVMLPGHVSLSTGIRRVHLRDAVVGNCCLHDVGLVARQVIHDAAAVFRVGSLVASGTSAFATGHKVRVGLETGGRDVPLFAEMDLELAAWLADNPGPSPEREAFEEALAAHSEAVRHRSGVVGEGSLVLNTATIRNSWIGAHARIDGAQLVRDTAVLSSIDAPTMVRDGAIVEHAVLQHGTRVRSHAIVRSALLCECAGASRHAKVTQSILGCNTEIQEGEVTSSLVGPLVGFHHQSLLIAALWPEGRGNVAHGAALGSNHTGRTADQELRPGEGQFFGLSCLVKFPGNFQDAPWSMIASGCQVPPGRFALPFSLIRPEAGEDRPLASPGWMWLHNAWALERAETKLAERDRTRSKLCARPFLHLDILLQVEKARSALLASPAWKTIGREALPEAGMCRVTESDRNAGVDAYTECLRLCALRALLEGDASPISEWSHAFLSREFPGMDEKALLEHLPGLERLWLRRVRRSRERDDIRGMATFDDYAAVHPGAKDDPVIKSASLRARETAKLVRDRLA
jgi:hypothetical protein